MKKQIQCTKISFTIPQSNFRAGQQNSMTISFCQRQLIFSLYYDHNEIPLSLKTMADPGDTAEIVILPYRLELYINGVLCDEEWPYGNCLYHPQTETLNGVFINVRREYVTRSDLPTITGSFQNAEGWRPDENIFVGDCMPYVDEGRYHVLYLKDRHHHGSKWRLGAHQWEHISTTDFHVWDIHPMAVEITDPSEASICTGSWMKHGGKYFLFYTIRTVDGAPAPIKRSISEDGYHFQKDTSFSFTLSKKYHQSSARDPKVIQAADGKFHMFLTTSLISTDKGCLAHLTSSDLNTWREESDPIYISESDAQPECPDYIKFKDKYYLIFSLHGKANYLFSDKPFSEWRSPEDPIIPCHAVPKGAVWHDQLIFTGFKPIGGYAGNMTFKHADAGSDGTLTFE